MQRAVIRPASRRSVLASGFPRIARPLAWFRAGVSTSCCLAKERLLHTCGAIDVLEPKPPSHTEPAVPLGRISPVAPFVLPGQRRGYADDFSVLGLKVHLAAVPAVVTRRRGFLHLPRLVQIFRELVRDSADRTDSEAVSAELAGQCKISLRHNLIESALLHELERGRSQHSLHTLMHSRRQCSGSY